MIFLKPFKKLLATLSLTIITLFSLAPAHADEIDVPYLTNIQNYTNSILEAVNSIPAYLTQISQLATSMLAADNSSSDPVDWSANWSNQQNWFATLNGVALANESLQYSAQKDLLTKFFGSSNLGSTPPLPVNVNDLSFSTLLGQLLVSPDPRSEVDPVANYLNNASGLGMPFPAPATDWEGAKEDQLAYTNFYNTVTSVQTYNAFVLSRMYQDMKALSANSELRVKLIGQSTSSDWFASIISNDLGWVLRQILVYSSQLYVLMDQLLQIQKQMLATNAMTNTLIISNSQFQAGMLLQKAKRAQSS